MKKFVGLFLLLAAPGAFAELQVLPGSSPQTALVQDVLPNPVRLRVLDGGVPVAGAHVTFRQPHVSPSYGPSVGSNEECAGGDLEQICSATTGPDGIAQFVTLTSYFAQTYAITMGATDSTWTRDLGSATLTFTFVPRSGAMQVSIVSGGDQQAVYGTQAAEPIRIRVRRGDGSPVANKEVFFEPNSGDANSLGFDGNAPRMVTDADGYATSPRLFAGWAVGDRPLKVSVLDSSYGAFTGASTTLKVVNEKGEPNVELTNMWWGGTTENGWGMSVVKHGSQLFNVLFIYDSEGKPTWVVQPGGTWAYGIGSVFVGPMYSPRSAPWFAYDASKLVAGASLGNTSTAFYGPTRGRLLAYLGTENKDKLLERQDFTGDAPSPMQGVADMWWGGESQNGWGIAVLEQFGNLFLVWFTYGDDGKPTWFVMPGGTWSDSRSYSGSIYRTAGTDWIVGPYDASKLKASTVGSYTMTFTPDGRATFGYVLEGRSGTLALERQPF